jgi:hypothetical protein
VFYIFYVKNLVLNNLFKIILLVGIVVLSFAVREKSKPLSVRSKIDVSVSSQVISNGSTVLIVRGDSGIVIDSVGNVVGYRESDSTYRVEREGDRYYYVHSVLSEFYVLSIIGLIVLGIVFLVTVFSEDGEWDFKNIWVCASKDSVVSVIENGRIIFLFRGRMVYSSDVLERHFDYDIEKNLGKFYKNPNLFPKWESVTQKRSRLLDCLV